MRLLWFALVLFLTPGCYPTGDDSTPAPEISYVHVDIHLGTVPADGNPWAPRGGLVTYTWAEHTPQTLAVRGVWQAEMVALSTPSGLVFVSGTQTSEATVYDLSVAAGGPSSLSIPYNLADHVTVGRADGAYTAGGWFYSPDEGLAYTVTWPDFCGAVWPCPADNYTRVTWSVTAPEESSGLWLAVDTGDVATDPFHVSWAWWADGQLRELGDHRVVAGRDEFLDTMEATLWDREVYLDAADDLLGGRPYPLYGLVDTGNWGVPSDGYSSGGGMEHTPYAYIDSVESLSYPPIIEHEYIHAWYSSKIGYPHIGEMIVAEGVTTYLEGVVRSEVDGGGLQNWITSLCRWASSGAKTAEYPAWCPYCEEVPPPDIYGPGLPYAAGALFLYDYSSDELGDPSALVPVLGDIANYLPPGSYGWATIVEEIENRTGISMDPYMQWVTLPNQDVPGATIIGLASACDI